jgi:hypothetical protein
MVVMLSGCMDGLSFRENGIQELVGLTPSSQTVWSLFTIPWLAKPVGKNQQKVIRQIHFNGKIHPNNFDQTIKHFHGLTK